MQKLPMDNVDGRGSGEDGVILLSVIPLQDDPHDLLSLEGDDEATKDEQR